MMSGHRESVQLLLPVEFSSLTIATVQDCVRDRELTDVQTDCINLVTSFLEQRAMIEDPLLNQRIHGSMQPPQMMHNTFGITFQRLLKQVTPTTETNARCSTPLFMAQKTWQRSFSR